MLRRISLNSGEQRWQKPWGAETGVLTYTNRSGAERAVERDNAKVKEIGSLLLIPIRYLNFIVSVKEIFEEF